FELSLMVEVRHDAQIHSAIDDTLEKVDKIVCILVRQELVWPEAQCFRADTYGLYIRFVVRIQERLNVLLEHFKTHNHGVTTREAQVRHFMMFGRIAHYLLCLPRGDFKSIHTDELRPAEAKCTVTVAGLSRTWEKQRRLSVLVLHTVEALALIFGHVELHLSRRVRIEPCTYRIGNQFKLILADLIFQSLFHNSKIL